MKDVRAAIADVFERHAKFYEDSSLISKDIPDVLALVRFRIEDGKALSSDEDDGKGIKMMLPTYGIPAAYICSLVQPTAWPIGSQLQLDSHYQARVWRTAVLHARFLVSFPSLGPIKIIPNGNGTRKRAQISCVCLNLSMDQLAQVQQVGRRFRPAGNIFKGVC